MRKVGWTEDGDTIFQDQHGVPKKCYVRDEANGTEVVGNNHSYSKKYREVACPPSYPPKVFSGPFKDKVRPNGGTIAPYKGGVNIALWGAGEGGDGFNDYSVSGCEGADVEGPDGYKEGRPLTGELEDRSVDVIFIRNSPFGDCEMKEICRICKNSCVVMVTLENLAAWKDQREVAFRGGGKRVRSVSYATTWRFILDDGFIGDTQYAFTFQLGPGDCPVDKERCP